MATNDIQTVPARSSAPTFYTSITGEHEVIGMDNNGTDASDSMTEQTFLFLVEEEFTATVSASMGVDDWGFLKIEDANNNEKLMLGMRSGTDAKPGSRGGHEYWEKALPKVLKAQAQVKVMCGVSPQKPERKVSLTGEVQGEGASKQIVNLKLGEYDASPVVYPLEGGAVVKIELLSVTAEFEGGTTVTQPQTQFREKHACSGEHESKIPVIRNLPTAR